MDKKRQRYSIRDSKGRKEKWADINWLIFSFVFFLPFSSFAQEKIEFSGEGSLIGILSSEDIIPFWFYKNTSTRIGEFTNGGVYGKSEAKFKWGKNNTLNAGVSLMLRDGIEEEFQRENLFLEYTNNWLKATLGAKERPILYNDLSSNNGNIIWSTNARPMPGLILEANQPIKISKTFALDWGIAHYSLNDERYVKDTRVHYKRIGLIVNLNEKHKITGQLQHFAQWAGTSPEYGELPNDLEAFVDVFFARSGNEEAPEGEIYNSVGNHLGSYLLDYQFKTNIGYFSTYHEHLFDDGSGTGFANFPDGVWGATFQPINKKVITMLLYEYVDTTNQSGSFGTSGRDNYFSNSIYRSGWTYEGNIIGTPFIITDPSIEITEKTSPIISNRLRAHHFGLMGTFNKIDWVFKTTISESIGPYNKPFDPALESWYNYLSFSYKTDKYGIFNVIGGADFSNITDTVIGGGLSYKYVF